MTTRRFQSLKPLAALAAATMMIGWFVAAPAASAGGIGDDIGGAVGNATGTATDTVNETTGSTTDTVNNTVNETTGSTTDTVNDTVGSTTNTVGDTAGSAGGTVGDTTGNVTGGGGSDGGGSGTGTVTDTVGGVTGTTETVTGGGVGGITSGGGSGSGDSVSGSGSGSGSTSASQNQSGSGSGTIAGPGPTTTTITLPDGSTIEVPVLTGGTIDGRKIFTSDSVGGLSPDAAALRGMLAGFVESDSVAGDVSRTVTGSESGTSFLDDAARAAAQAARKLAFPMTLVIIVGIFVLGHGRIGRKDPKLMLAPVDNEEETLTFR